MNGIGPNTTIKAQTLPVVTAAWIVMILLWVLFVPCLVLWILGRKKWQRTEAYQVYAEARKAWKQEKKAPAVEVEIVTLETPPEEENKE
jgi:hypothetical protein